LHTGCPSPADTDESNGAQFELAMCSLNGHPGVVFKNFQLIAKFQSDQNILTYGIRIKNIEISSAVEFERNELLTQKVDAPER
jgi:hypothetical protein